MDARIFTGRDHLSGPQASFSPVSVLMGACARTVAGILHRIQPKGLVEGLCSTQLAVFPRHLMALPRGRAFPGCALPSAITRISRDGLEGSLTMRVESFRVPKPCFGPAGAGRQHRSRNAGHHCPAGGPEFPLALEGAGSTARTRICHSSAGPPETPHVAHV